MKRTSVASVIGTFLLLCSCPPTVVEETLEYRIFQAEIAAGNAYPCEAGGTFKVYGKTGFPGIAAASLVSFDDLQCDLAGRKATVKLTNAGDGGMWAQNLKLVVDIEIHYGTDVYKIPKANFTTEKYTVGFTDVKGKPAHKESAGKPFFNGGDGSGTNGILAWLGPAPKDAPGVVKEQGLLELVVWAQPIPKKP